MNGWSCPLTRVAALVALVLACAGCGQGSRSISSASKAFQSASPETKTAWQSIAASVKSNDYVAALVGLQKLRLQGGLTPEQVQAVDQTSAAVSDRMYAAANKGDAKAAQAIQELRKSMSR